MTKQDKLNLADRLDRLADEVDVLRAVVPAVAGPEFADAEDLQAAAELIRLTVK